MNRNTLTGFILIALVLILFSWWSQPSQEEIDTYNRQQDSIAAALANAEKQKKEAEQQHEQQAAAAALGDTTSLFYSALNGQDQALTLKNGKVELTVNTKGGTIGSARLPGFQNRDNSDDVMLFTREGQQMNFIMEAKEDNIVTGDLYFTPTEHTDSTLTLTAQASNGGQLQLRYQLGPDYMLHFQLQAKGMGKLFSPTRRSMAIEWQDSCRQQEKGFTFENQRSALTYKKSDGGTDYLNETSD